MKILMVSSEVIPFAKSGGLGDAVSALSRALSRSGHDVRIILPRYYCIDRSGLAELDRAITVRGGFGSDSCSVYVGKLPGSSVPVYFLDHERSFGRDGIYGTKLEPDFSDNPHRFATLCRGAFALCRALGWTPDIFHAHDWPAALVPVFLKYEERSRDFGSSASVLSVHNLGYQGVYAKDCFPSFNLPWELFHGAGFEFYDRVNMLKAGLANADFLSTVSPSYAREIQTPDFGFGLDGLLRARSNSLVGILNGVDLEAWDPARDSRIPAHFSEGKMRGKGLCKKALQKTMGLPEDSVKPVIGMVARLSDQKGIGELFGPLSGSAYKLCADLAIQFAVLGSGEDWCEREISSLSERLPNFKAVIGYDEKLAHLIEAGSDFFMMPSRYEPCGLNQMYSLRYGTLPIAHRTGGLADTIENYNQDAGTGTGFLFDQLTSRSIYDTTGWAVWAWYNKPKHIAAMRERAMARRFTWDESAGEYEKLYRCALEGAVCRDRYR